MKKTFSIFGLLCLLAFSPIPLLAASTDSNTSPAVLAERLGALQQRVDEIRQTTEDKVEQKLKFLEAQQRNIDLGNSNLNFWFSALSIMFGLVGALVAFLGWWLPKKEKEELRREYESVKREQEAMRREHDLLKQQAQLLIEKMQQMHDQAHLKLEEIEAKRKKVSQVRPDGDVLGEVVMTAQNLAKEQGATAEDKLRAVALEAHSKGRWASALDLWRALIRLQPRDVQALFMQAYAIHELVNKGESPPVQLEEVARLYKQVTELNPKECWAFNNWGTALSELAKTKSGKEAERLFWEAGEKYALAIEIKPDLHESFGNWGITLSELAKTKSGEEEERLIREAGEKYARAIEIKPDYHEGFKNWAGSLLNLAKTKSGIEWETLLNQAHDKAFQAETLKPGEGAYNLACIAALREQEAECREWLGKSRQHGGLPDCAHLKTDSDLDSVRQFPWFQELLREVCAE